MVLELLLNLLIFLIPAAVAGVLARKHARESRDQWQLLAWIPVTPLAVWGVYVAIGITRDPTSHNLWPFELAAWVLLSVLLWLLFVALRRLAGGKAAP